MDPRKRKKQKGQRVKVLARRNPTPKYLNRRKFLSRAADRNLSGSSYHEPPRTTRGPLPESAFITD